MKIDLLKYNPLYGYIDFTVLGKNLSDFGNKISDCVMSLNFERKGEPKSGYSGSSFTLELYDDTAVEIEAIISNALATFSSKTLTCSIGYGWASRGRKITGFTVTGSITEYTLDFDGPSTTLSITGVVQNNGAVAKISSGQYPAKVYKGEPSKIVKEICEKEGIPIGKIEEAEPILDKQQDNKPKTFLRKNQSALSFINNSFANAKSKETGKVGFKFYIGRDNKAYFVSTDTSNRENVDTKKVKEDTVSKSLAEEAQTVVKMNESINKALSKINNVVSTANKILGVFSGLQGVGNKSSSKTLNTDGSSSVSSGEGNVVFVGGTIIKNIKEAIPETENLVYIYKDSADYNWLVSSLDLVKSYCKIGSRVYFLLGENDMSNYDKYVTFYKSLTELKNSTNSQLYVVSLLPVDSYKCTTIQNANLLNFNTEISKGLFSSEIKFIDLFTYYRGELANRDTMSDGVNYKKSVYQDVFNRILNYEFAIESQVGYQQYSGQQLNKQLTNVEKTAVALSNSKVEDCAKLLSSVNSICNGSTNYTEAVGNLIKVIYPSQNNYSNYVNTSSKITTIVGKNNDNVDYGQISQLISTLNLPNEASKYANLVSNIVKVVNSPESIKNVSSITGFAQSVAGLFVNSNTNMTGYTKIVDSVSSVLGLGNKATTSDYNGLVVNLLNLMPVHDGEQVTRYANIASNLVKVLNDGNCKVSDVSNLVTGVIGSISPKAGAEAMKYVSLASTLTNTFQNGKISDFSSLASSLSSLTGNPEVSKYVSTAKDLWSVFQGGASAGGINLDSMTMNLSSPLGNVVGKTEVAKNVENALKGTGITDLSSSNIGKGVSENLSDLTSGGGIGGAIKNSEKTPATLDNINFKSLSSIINKNRKEVSASYEYYSGDKSNIVISFSPSFTGKQIMDKGFPGTAVAIDAIRNEMLEVTANNDLSKFIDTHRESKNSLIMGMSASNFATLDREVLGLWNRYYGQGLKATLEVMGDVDVDINTWIKIAVYTKYGFLHHTSGYYFVEGVTDSVSGGTFTTSLELKKNSEKSENLKAAENSKQEESKVKDDRKKEVNSDGVLTSEPPDGKYWVRQHSGVALKGCQSKVLDVLETLGKWYYDRNGGRYRLVVTAGTNGSHASGQYSHAMGWKVDVNDWGGPENNPGGYLVDNAAGQYVEDWRPAFRDYGHNLGMGTVIEGDHIDVQFADGYDWGDGKTYGPVRV